METPFTPTAEICYELFVFITKEYKSLIVLRSLTLLPIDIPCIYCNLVNGNSTWPCLQWHTGSRSDLPSILSSCYKSNQFNKLGVYLQYHLPSAGRRRRKLGG